MKIQELMERVGMKESGLALAWLKDAYHLIQSNSKEDLKVVKYNIIDGERDYLIPQDMVAIDSVSVKDTSDDKYKKIRRLNTQPPTTEDTDPE
jgi:hypothetical protein|tara:strand:- start:707 stop:985 length:279 start_codon:yes stop_codon:yes gene_type:complete